MGVWIFAKVLTVYVSVICHVTCRLQLVNNGFEGLNIVIKEGVPEDPKLLSSIKEVFTKFSKTMYASTRNRAYLRNVTIVVPKSWTNGSKFQSIHGVTVDTQLIEVVQKNSQHPVPLVTGNVMCGVGGRTIEVAPKFLLAKNGRTNFGKVDHVLLHEWGHLRWGLFSEYPSIKRKVGKGKIQYYLADGEWQPVSCTRNLRGKHKKLGGKKEACDRHTNTYPECVFRPAQKQRTKASIMSYQYLPANSMFCDKDERATDASYRHNSKAENLQNLVCNSRSAWEVMKGHEDFANGKNPAGPQDMDTEPYYRIVQVTGRVRVFVLDISGSMNADDRLQALEQAVTLVIGEQIEDGSRVGLVEFNKYARITANLTSVNSKEDRDALIDKLPQYAAGKTSIGAGLEMALKVLDGTQKDHCEIILVTDGKNTDPPTVSDVTQDLMIAGVVVNTITISQAAEQNLADLAILTGGLPLTYQANDDISDLINAMSQVINKGSDATSPESIFSKAFTTSVNGSVTDTFIVDDGLGNDTVLTVLADFPTDIHLSVTGPNKFTFEGTETGTKRAVFGLGSIVPNGEFRFVLKTTDEAKISIYVKSVPRSSDSPVIRVKSWLSNLTMDFSSANNPVRLFAEVRKGDNPVLGANVTASLDCGQVTYIPMSDSGVGVDTIKDDGVYTGFVIQSMVTSGGRCTVKIGIKGDNSTVITKTALGSNSMLNPEFATEEDYEEEAEEPVGEFNRLSLPGELTVVNYVEGQADITPPARIQDLHIGNILADKTNVTFTLSWTAVGNDIIIGQASQYHMILDSNMTSLQSGVDSETSTYIDTSMLVPKVSGELETFDLVLTPELCNGTCFVAIKAIDDVGNYWGWSNAISVIINLPKPVSVTSGAVVQVSSAYVALIMFVLVGLSVYM